MINSTIEILVPYLFEFIDDEIVFSNEMLKTIENALLDPINGVFEKNEDKNSAAFPYTIRNSGLNSMTREETGSKYLPIPRVEAYCYHHRLIIRYLWSGFNFDLEPEHLRLIRGVASKNADTLARKIIDIINQKISSLNTILWYYSYCIILCPQKAFAISYPNRLSDLIGSHTITTVKVKLISNQNNYIRVSIPSVIFFFEDKLRFEEISRIINVIYQHVLYRKKLSVSNTMNTSIREYKSSQPTTLIIEAVELFNRKTDSDLCDTWNYFNEAFGGKPVDITQASENLRAIFYALIALVASIIVEIIF